MTLPPDVWLRIRADFEQGISQHNLARKYGVTQATISRHATAEQWRILERISPVSVIQNDTPPENTDSILSVIETLLKKIVEHAQNDLDIKEIKLAADAVSQFHKIRLTSPDEQHTESGIPGELLPFLSLERLNRLAELKAEEMRILDEARDLQLEASGVQLLRKRG